MRCGLDGRGPREAAGNCTLQNISFFPPGVLRTSHLALPEANAGEAFGKIRFYLHRGS